MPTIQQVLAEMEQYMLTLRDRREALGELRPYSFGTGKAYQERREALNKEVIDLEKQMERLLLDFEREPDRLSRLHSHKLPVFNQDGNGAFEDFVFIMTKFPDLKDKNPEGPRLSSVIGNVADAVKARGYKPRIASEKDYNRWLFGNVELFLCGCARGIAIVEDKYLPELNPNVAIEWGWMTGMGRDVLYLREQGFDHARADWTGLTNYTFDWNDPKPGIDSAVNKFLSARP
jgi:hypothetical protein